MIKFSIKAEDEDGIQYNIKLDGNATGDKVRKIYEMFNLLDVEKEPHTQNPTSVGSKILNIIDKYYPMGKFTSKDLREKYEDEYNQPIKLSVIATYLSRFNNKNKIDRAKSGREWIYQTARIAQPTN